MYVLMQYNAMMGYSRREKSRAVEHDLRKPFTNAVRLKMVGRKTKTERKKAKSQRRGKGIVKGKGNC